MNFKTTYLLFGLLAVLLGVLAAVLFMGPSAPLAADSLFPTMQVATNKIKPGDITRVAVDLKKDGTQLVLERVDEKNWKITSPRNMVADGVRVTSLIDNLMNAQFDPERNPQAGDGGTNDPSRVVTIAAGEREWTLTVGESTPGKESAVVFVKSSDRPGMILAVKKSSIESVLESVNYFRNKELLGDSTDIQVIKITDPKKGTVELRRESAGWKMTQPPYGPVDANSLTTAVGAMRVDYRSEKENDFVKDQATKLTEYGLDPAKDTITRIEVTHGEGKSAKTQAILVGKQDGTKYFVAIDEGKPAKDVVKILSTDVEPFTKLLTDPSSIRNKNLVMLDNFREPDAIDLKNSYGVLEFRRPDAAKPWQLYRDKTSYNVDDIEAKKLVDELKKKDIITSFPDPKRRKELGLENPLITVKIYSDSLVKPDTKEKEKDKKEKDSRPTLKKDAKPLAELRFGIPERDNVAVERIWGEDSTIVMVPLSLLDQVRKGPLAYVDKSIPPYTTGPAEDSVTKLEITRGNETFVITRESDKAKWKIAKPDNLKDRLADDLTIRDLLNRLNTMRAQEVYAEKADAKEMANYGLTTPSVKVVITQSKDKKLTTHEFLFGKEEAGKGVFAKLGNKDTIYRVGPEILDVLRRELRDTTILTFDTDKVTTIKLKGWKHVAGSTLTRTFEQKDGKWIAKEPADFPLDTAKVSEFVNNLSRLKAERFLPAGSTLKADTKSLQIEITLSDKKVLELTVGSEDGAGYQATSSQLKGDVFVVSRLIFEQAKDKPAYFSK